MLTDDSIPNQDGSLPSVARDDRIVINVSGMIFETRSRTLSRFPNTLLGCPERRGLYYVRESNEYFFNRNRSAFDAILYYYQSFGRLRRPDDVPMGIFREEVEFFDLDEKIIQALLVTEGYVEEKVRELPSGSFKRKVWLLFEYPESSAVATCLAVWSMTIIVLAILASIVESMPSVQKAWVDETSTSNHTATAINLNNSRSFRDPWFVLEVAFNSWFTFEYCVRFCAAPKKFRFFISLLNLIDLTAVTPFYIMLVVDNSRLSTVSILRILRIVRVFRMFKLSRYSRSLQIIGYCVFESMRELGLLILCLFFTVVVSATLIFYVEIDVEGTGFTSIPATFWFSIQTITTIGYGDLVPETIPGKLMSAACMIFGALTLALPVLTFVSNFNKLYYRNMHESNHGSIGGKTRVIEPEIIAKVISVDSKVE